MNALGLKEFFATRKTRKLSLCSFLRELRWELKYAWQRAGRGYDFLDTIECSEMFRRRMIRVLNNYAEYGHGLLNIPTQSEHYDKLLEKFPEPYFDEEHTKLIFQTMIAHLEMMDEDYVEKIIFGKNVYDNDYKVGCRTLADYKRIAEVVEQNKNAFMKLFSLFFYQLWD